MENRPVIEQLAEKIDALLARLKSLEEENARLRNELVAVKAQNEAKDAQIAKLNEELAMKDLEIEEVIGKIEAILGE
jgi:septal ring factor EnvC (AmiA/AmiB activator)